MNDSELIISGVHMDLTESLKETVAEKAEKLFKHEEKIIRLRIELEYNQNKTHAEEFIAKGHIEINGPPLIVSVASEDMHKSIDQLVDKLDRKLRRRSRMRKVKRKQTGEVEIPAELPKVGAMSL